MADNVNHPAHYETGKFACIDVMVETQGVEATQNIRELIPSVVTTVLSLTNWQI